jgi:hypothetical protein
MEKFTATFDKTLGVIREKPSTLANFEQRPGKGE